MGPRPDEEGCVTAGSVFFNKGVERVRFTRLFVVDDEAEDFDLEDFVDLEVLDGCGAMEPEGSADELESSPSKAD
jgi:hypothetical protein